MDVKFQDTAVQEAAIGLSRTVHDAGGRALLVGGCVRDAALGQSCKDVDIEVYGIAPQKLRALLSTRFTIDLVGENFGVLKIRHYPIDVAIPRRETQTGRGHRDFDISADPELPMDVAAARRDFTINAMSLDPLTGELYDFFGGMDDLQNRILRHTSPRFVEDALRVLRGMQFAARLELTPATDTVALCASITPSDLARERIFEEWRKLVVQGVRPSLGLEFIRSCNWLQHFPELEALVNCPQDPEWHPEGDAWSHTVLCMDAFASHRIGDEFEDMVVGFAVLCHDLGKPSTTRKEGGRWRSKGHTEAGEPPTREFLARMTDHRDLVEAIVPLVREHLRPVYLHAATASDAAVRRLAHRVGRIDRLVRVAIADHEGRHPMEPGPFTAGNWLLERAHALDVADQAPKPILMGRHLIDMGLTPGPMFSPLLKACYKAQLDGKFNDLEGGLAFARRQARKQA